jgi:hypothetical protein
MGILFGGYKTLTVYSEGHYENGRWREGPSTENTILADIQPITGEELKSLNVGRENVGKIKIYTNNKLNIGQEGTSISDNVVKWINGDKITWNNEIYELIAEEIRDNNILNHYKYIGELRK